MKKLSILSTLLITLTLTFPLPTHALSFTYSFLARTAGNEILPLLRDTPDLLSPDQPLPLSHTDTLKIFLKPGTDTYMYLFLYDAEGGLFLLFPEKISDIKCCYTFNKPYTYPPGDQWTGFDETGGTEQFILLASETRLSKLEHFTTDYMEKLFVYWGGPEKKGMERKMAEARHLLLDQIRKVRLEHSDFTSIKEELVVIAGEFRGEDEVTGQKVTAGGFYAKTIRIEHAPPPGGER